MEIINHLNNQLSKLIEKDERVLHVHIECVDSEHYYALVIYGDKTGAFCMRMSYSEESNGFGVWKYEGTI